MIQFNSLEKRANTPMKPEINRKVKEVLAKINSRYEPGCVQWATMYANSDWENAFNDLEDCLITGSDGMVFRKIRLFEETIADLQAQYSKIRKQQSLAGFED